MCCSCQSTTMNCNFSDTDVFYNFLMTFSVPFVRSSAQMPVFIHPSPEEGSLVPFARTSVRTTEGPLTASYNHTSAFFSSVEDSVPTSPRYTSCFTCSSSMPINLHSTVALGQPTCPIKPSEGNDWKSLYRVFVTGPTTRGCVRVTMIGMPKTMRRYSTHSVDGPAERKEVSSTA